MHPELGRVGDLVIYSYGVLNLASAFFFVALMAVLLRARGANAAPAVDLTLLMIIGYTLFARIFEVVLARDWEFFTDFSAERLTYGYWGGQVGFAAPASVYLLFTREPFAPLADALAVTWAGATVFHKLGCFLGGCCGGSPSAVPWAMTFPGGGTAEHPGVPVHPTQLYDAFSALVITAVLLAAYFRRRAEGRLLLWWGLAYAGTKIASDGFRANPKFLVAEGISAALLVEMLAAVACLLLLARPNHWNRLLAWHDRRSSGSVDPAGTRGRWTSFFLGVGGFVAASVIATLASLALSWPGTPLVVYVALFMTWELAGVRGLWGFRLVDRLGTAPATFRLFIRGLVAAVSPLSFFGLFRPLFDRWSRSLGDAAAGTRVVRPQGVP